MWKWLTTAATAIVALPLAIMLAVSVGAPPGAAAGAFGGAPTALAKADIPARYLVLYMDAAATCPGLPRPVLAGIGKAETDHGRSPLPGVHSGANAAGAEGPTQFLPATFAHCAVDGDHDGRLNIYDAADAVFTAAAMLCADGAADPEPVKAGGRADCPGGSPPIPQLLGEAALNATFPGPPRVRLTAVADPRECRLP